MKEGKPVITRATFVFRGKNGKNLTVKFKTLKSPKEDSNATQG